MKKIVVLLLCLAMVAGFSFSASAAGVGDTPVDVLVKFTDASGNPLSVATVYALDIEFGTLVFNAKASENNANMKWNPADHTYVDSSNNAVTYTITNATINNAIKVKNHSNHGVNVNPQYVGNVYSQTTNGVTVDIYEGASICSAAYTLDTAEGTTLAGAPSVSYDLKASGSPTIGGQFTVGTIVVKISAT